MRDLPAYDAIFGAARPLPRGPHGLSREEVAASQRARLLAAIVDIVADKGYARATIGEIGREAGVSPRSFYEHFDNKLSCFLAAYDTFSGVLLERILEQLQDDVDIDELTSRGLAVYLVTLRDNPHAARAFLCEMNSAGPVARQRRRDTHVKLASGLRELRCRRRPAGAEVPQSELAYRAVIHGVREVAHDMIESGDTARLPDLLPELTRWVLVTVRGGRRPDR